MSSSEANPMFTYLSKNIDILITLLVDHPAMTPEVTPEPQPKNKVQYMYDYMTRIRSELEKLDPSVPSTQSDQWTDVLQQALSANILINDQPEKLTELTQEANGKELDFGNEIRNASKALTPEGIRQSLAQPSADSDDEDSAVA